MKSPVLHCFMPGRVLLEAHLQGYCINYCISHHYEASLQQLFNTAARAEQNLLYLIPLSAEAGTGGFYWRALSMKERKQKK